jgi:hypothetical protein
VFRYKHQCDLSEFGELDSPTTTQQYPPLYRRQATAVWEEVGSYRIPAASDDASAIWIRKRSRDLMGCVGSFPTRRPTCALSGHSLIAVPREWLYLQLATNCKMGEDQGRAKRRHIAHHWRLAGEQREDLGLHARGGPRLLADFTGDNADIAPWAELPGCPDARQPRQSLTERLWSIGNPPYGLRKR